MTPLATGLACLAAAGLALVTIGATTARRPDEPIPSLVGWFARWQVQHRAPDLDPSTTTVLRYFLMFTYRLATPLARHGVRPGVVTAGGLWLALGVPVLAQRWPLAAAGLCGASAVVDGVDGAVAGLTNRATPLGFVLDSVIDRAAEIAFFSALIVVGGDARLAAAGWAGSMILEYVRARAGNAGMGEVGTVTVAERPTRVLCVVFGLVGGAIKPHDAARSANIAAWIALAFATVGLVQLASAVRKGLQQSNE